MINTVDLGPLEKPLDVGNGELAASLDGRGRVLSVGTAHNLVGYVELTAAPTAPDGGFASAAAVRRYRALLATNCPPAVAVSVPNSDEIGRRRLLDGAFPVVELPVAGGHREVTTWAVPGRSVLRQRHRFVGTAGPLDVVVRVTGRLDRPTLGEISEGGPLPPTGAVTTWNVDGEVAVGEAPTLPARAEVRIEAVGWQATAWQQSRDGAERRLHWPVRPGGDPELHVSVALDVDRNGPRWSDPLCGGLDEARRWRRTRVTPSARADTRPAMLTAPPGLAPSVQFLTERAVDYALGCAAVRTGPDEVCLLADHRLLPLSWTRDAYWSALLLLAHGSPAGLAAVEAHLRWLWTRCERPDSRWRRSHLPSGQVKDGAWQADQQLYPVLELCDFASVTGRLPELPQRDAGAWDRLVERAWRALVPDPATGLLASDENPADDATDQPFLLSTQILWWWAATRLAARQQVTGLAPDADAAAVAATLAPRLRAAFTVDGPGDPHWVYAIDGQGGVSRYHDANDLPTAVAPLWGFCPPDDPQWRATMAFAFSSANPGYVSGRRGGLGSRHTPGTWPLGDVQEWVAASLAGAPARAERALRRLVAAATPDGMLPEAYDPDVGRPLVRHWFAWPGAALGALWLAGGRVDVGHG